MGEPYVISYLSVYYLTKLNVLVFTDQHLISQVKILPTLSLRFVAQRSCFVNSVTLREQNVSNLLSMKSSGEAKS